MRLYKKELVYQVTLGKRRLTSIVRTEIYPFMLFYIGLKISRPYSPFSNHLFAQNDFHGSANFSTPIIQLVNTVKFNYFGTTEIRGNVAAIRAGKHYCHLDNK